MTRPLVSVLLPYRDAGETIEEALTSVLEERAVELEVIAVDDGSRDDGAETVATEGVGIARALARGHAIARGRLVARMDADDVSLPGRFEAQAAMLDGDVRLGVVGTQVEAFPAVGEGMLRYVAWMNSLVSPEDHERDLFVESPLCHPSVMMRREALDDAGGYRDVPWAEDYDLWLRLAARGWAIAKVARVMLRWRHSEARATLRDPRYALPRFDAAKACYLAPRLLAKRRPVAVWGAGKTGKRIARALAQSGACAEVFADIDPRKIGRVARGAPIVRPDELERGRHTVVVAVGARGARLEVRAWLDARGFVEGVDYVCAS